VFSVGPVPRLYNKDQVPLQVSPETAVRRVEEVGVRWLSGCKDMSLQAEECLLLEATTKECSEDHDQEH
jgi:hypothetical protein